MKTLKHRQQKLSRVELEEVTCYYCGAKETSLWGEEAGFRARKCSQCGLVYVSPRPRKESIDASIRIGEHATEHGSISSIGRYRSQRVRRCRRLIARLFGDIPSETTLRWLDVGAGFGELLKAVSLVFPMAVVFGIEPNDAKRRGAAKRGITLSGTSPDALPRSSFDVISVMNVWSHLPDPLEFLRQLAKLLVPRGLILIETGNGGDLDSAEAYPDALLLPDHLSFAGERHVIGVLERSGFEVEDMNRKRIDTVGFAVESLLRRLIGRKTRLVVPYRSQFRTIEIRARVRYTGD